MQKIKRLFILAMALGLISCDNDVDITGDFVDTTVVYALIDERADTNFVKVNKAFLEDGVNAIDLAKETDRLFYDNLEVTLESPERNDLFTLATIAKPKSPGVFSTEKNILYYTDGALAGNTVYNLSIKQPDGKLTTASIELLPKPTITNPRFRPDQTRQPISFVSDLGGIIDYDFEFRLNAKMAQAQVHMEFFYTEIVGSNRIPRTVRIPVGIFTNTDLEAGDYSLIYKGESFFQTIAANVPDNGNVKEVALFDCLHVYVTVVDQIYTQYTSIYGPLDGIAQVRPEFTNVTNGVGLVASRTNEIAITNLNDKTREELANGSITGGLDFDIGN